jgi:hypothetical protein
MPKPKKRLSPIRADMAEMIVNSVDRVMKQRCKRGKDDYDAYRGAYEQVSKENGGLFSQRTGLP